ncbi:MAG: 3-phosphoshikimate 1-carboxyvinyltransferase [Ktedonobacteraceae bacterium]
MSQKISIAPSVLRPSQPDVPSSKYYTLRYVLAATLAEGESRIVLPAHSDDSDALFRGCIALGARLSWEDETKRVLRVHGAGRPRVTAFTTPTAPTPPSTPTASPTPAIIDVGNAGAVLRLLLGAGALLPDVTFVTGYPQSLGKRPNRELLEALTALGVSWEGSGPEGCLPIRLRGGRIRGGRVTISGARSSQYLSSLLFLAPFADDALEIVVVDELKSQPLVRASLEVLREAGIVIEHDEALRHFFVATGQQYQPREYIIPGDYPSAAALLAAYAASNDPASEVRLARLRADDEVGTALLVALRKMGADLSVEHDRVTLRGGRTLRGAELNGDPIIDCVPVLVAAACFADGESIFSNIESLHYKESDRIDDLCSELKRAGCAVEPRRDAIVVHGQPQGVAGGVAVDGHNDHRVLMALAIVGLRSRAGLTLTGIEHIAKSYPHFFAELQRSGADIQDLP